MKLPLLVIILFILGNLSAFNNILAKYIPKMITYTGQASQMSVVVRAFIIAVVFYISKKLFF